MPVRKKNQTRVEFSGGTYFGPVYVADHIEVPRQPQRALRGLPRKAQVFKGRETDLAALLELLEPDGAAAAQSPVGVITGLPGVGKTELAVQAAHAALENGWFPGGVLFIDLRGYDQERPLTAEAALDEMLRMMGIAAEDIPPGDYRARLFSSVLAECAATGWPVLVVIDNVASSEIAKALVPAAATTLVTSRDAMAGITGQRIDLGELSEVAAVEMLAAELQVSHPTDTRVADQYEDALSIARLCGELPLALHIIAALLTGNTTRPLSSMARDLRDASTRLDEMRYPEDTKGERGVRAAFDLSYRKLDAEQARVLRLLPINLGQEISTEAVAAMAELDVRTARQRLEELRSTHLIKAGSSYGQNGRWQMHDLISLYVSGITQQRDKQVAFFQLLFYYLENTRAAADLLDPVGARPGDSPFADRGQALEWLDTEYSNLTPFGYFFPSEPEFARTLTTDLFLWLWRYFELRRRTDDWITFTSNALAVAQALGDRGREGEALTKLGGAFRQARRFDEAVDACRDAISIQRELGDRHAEGVALNNLAAALLESRRYDEGIAASQDAAAIFQETSDRRREGIALANLGGALLGTRQYAQSAAAYEQAARLFREVGDQLGESSALTNLGNALRLSGGEPAEGIDLHRQAAAVMAEAGDWHGQGMALVNLSAALLAAGNLDEAIATAREAARLMRDTDDPHGLGSALMNLGTGLLETDRAGEAVETLGDAMTAYHLSGDQDAEAEARIRLGNALEQAGNRAAAIEAFRAAAEMCHDTANRRREGQALGELGSALLEAKKGREAVTTLRAAAAASRAAGDYQSEAKALMGLGTALLRGHAADDAAAAYSDAMKLYRRADNEELANLASQAVLAAQTVKHVIVELNARLAAGRFEEAIDDYLTSNARRADDRDYAGDMAAELGGSLRAACRFGQAMAILEDAVTAFREAGEPGKEHAARAELEAAREAQLKAQAAADALEQALRSADVDGQALQVAIDEVGHHLGPHDARFFRLLSASPGPDISLPAAAILANTDRATTLARLEELSGLAAGRKHRELSRRISDLYQDDVKAARGALGVLTQMRLVERDPAGRDRWLLPTAIRPYAAQQSRKYARQDLRDTVQTLLHLYYLAGAHAASVSLDSGIIAPALRESQANGLRWLDAEYQNLVGTVRDAADNDLGAVIALDLTRSLHHIMSLKRQVDDDIELGQIASRAARRLHDRHAEAVVLRNLGGTLVKAERQDEAITPLRNALAIYQDLGDLHGEGTTMTSLGSALTHAGQLAEAGLMLRAAIDIHHRNGSSFSEAVALASLGTLLDTTGQIEEAITSFKAADRIYRKIGDQQHRSGTLANLAGTLRKAGHYDEADKTYKRAATLARLTGDWLLVAVALAGLAEVYRATGRQDQADDLLQEVAQLAPGTDDARDRGQAGAGAPVWTRLPVDLYGAVPPVPAGWVPTGELPRILTVISSINSLPRYARTAEIGTLILRSRSSMRAM
jgi:tetratricopeptide (TPR) repeat protein